MENITLNLEENDYRSVEAFKALRTSLEFSGMENRVLAFTSCTPSEGKSTVSLHIAKSLSDMGKKVLFVDADMRKSMHYSKYGRGKNIQGLSHFLSDQVELKDVLCKTEYEGLSMIFSGPVPPNPAELLSGKKFESFINAAGNHYDYVIVDTPPVGNVIDGAIAGKKCDAIVLVVKANAISRKYVRKTKEQLEQLGCKILGVVLNGVDMKKDKYYGKYYGDY